jgi:excinuclease ABC subunit C
LSLLGRDDRRKITLNAKGYRSVPLYSQPVSLESLPFDPAGPKAALAQLPQSPAVFALYGADAHAEPYIGRTPNLRSRLERLLEPSPRHPRRLHLAGLVRRIEWQLTGSEFESLLVQFDLLQNQYGTKCLERMHLRHPAFVRFLGGNPYPRIVVTNRPSQREADWAYGPFPSRTAAERYAEEALKLFLLRRCTFDLSPDPSFPGCVYSEMKMCLAPCYKGCTGERYAEEAAAVESFLATRGESRLVTLRAQRDEASGNLEFESAAALHAQVQRVESVRALAAELVRPMSRLRAVILQASARPDEVAVFLFENCRLSGPAAFSTLGMRIQNEQSGSTSLFAQPMAIEPTPERQELGIRDQGTENKGPGTRDVGTSDQGVSEQEIEGAEINTGSPGDVLKGHDFSRANDGQHNEGALAPEGTVAPAQETAFAHPAKIPRGLLESRLEAALAELAEPSGAPSTTLRQAHLALLKRWYYRPEARRPGEIFFPDTDGRWPIKSILRGVGRVAAKSVIGASHD